MTGIILVYVQISLLVNISEMFVSIYRFRSCPDSAKNGSDPITDPITGSALIVGMTMNRRKSL